MRKYLLIAFLLISSFAFGQTYSNTGTANLQRAPTSKGYIYRNNMGALGNVNWYTSAQLDSLLGLLPAPGTALLKANNLSDVANAATSLHNLNGLSIADTAAMLHNYVSIYGDQNIYSLKSFHRKAYFYTDVDTANAPVNIYSAPSTSTIFNRHLLRLDMTDGFSREGIYNIMGNMNGGAFNYNIFMPQQTGQLAVVSQIPTSLPTPQSLTNGYGILGSPFNGGTAQSWKIDSTLIANKTWVQGYTFDKAQIIAGYQPLLGYIPENVANKVTDFTVLNNTVYPTTQAISNYLATNYAPIGIGGYKLKSDTLYAHGYVPQWQFKKSVVTQIDSLNGLGVIPAQSYSMLVFTDSQGTATGGVSYFYDFSSIFVRSLYNVMDKGFPNNRTFMYQTTTNMALALYPNSGITSNGTLIAAGLPNSRLSLTAGQTIKITNHSIRYADVIYNGSNSSGTLTVTVNGVNVRTITLSGSGTQNSYTGANIAGPQQTAMTDTITLTASANCEIMGVETLHESHLSPNIYMAGRTATTFSDYNNSAAYTEAAFYLNTLGFSGLNHYAVLALGTNSIYAPTKAQTPIDYILSCDTLIKNLPAGTIPILITPPRSNESLWPVIKSGYTYQDYVNAMIAYAHLHGYVLVRLDLTQLGTGNPAYLLSDGLHLNYAGQAISAAAFCKIFNVPINGSYSENTFNGVDASLNFPQITNNGLSTVLRDINGNFDAGNITASLTGNASTATKLATSRTIGITGDITYVSPSFDGSSNVTAVATLPTVNSNVGTFNNITINAKGQATAGSNIAYLPVNNPTYTGVLTGTNTGSVQLQIGDTGFPTAAFTFGRNPTTGFAEFKSLQGSPFNSYLFDGNITSTAFITSGGTSSQLVTGTGSLTGLQTVNGRTILGTGDILGTTNTTAGYPTAYPTDYVFKSAHANGNAFGLALIDSLNRTSMSITPNGTMNLTDFSGLLGGVAVLRNAGTAVANEIAGHFAASSLDSLGNQSTKGYFIVTALNTSGVNQYSSVGLGYMDNVNAYPGGVYFRGEPNKFVNFSHLGFILPTIPIKDVSGTVTMDATNFILKNSGVGNGININPFNDTLWDYFNLTATTTNNGVSFVTTANGTAAYPYFFNLKTVNGSAQYIYSNGTNNYITVDNTSNASPNSLVFGVAAASSSGLSANHALTINPGAGAFETITTTGVNLSGNVGLGSGFTTSTGTIQSTHGIFTTDLYGPIFFGGTAANSSLNLKSTSGVGTTDAIVFKVGNNGATEAGRFLDAGTFQLTTSPVTSAGTYNLLTWNTSTGAVEKSTALPNGTTATTQSAGDNSTKVATTAYVDATATTSGSWTPSGTNVGSATGTYTKTGKQVFCYFNIIVSTNISGSSFNLTGLPFTNGSAYGAVTIGNYTPLGTPLTTPITGDVSPSATSVTFYTSGSIITQAQFSNSSLRGVIIFSL